ncbi:MAG TPA: DUF4112 domain-containing protein [Candidatus Limnocylindrales bacterium]|nr:DUF4112 domain-containing protein [Candidatus Limnocylindrales bacterium]
MTATRSTRPISEPGRVGAAGSAARAVRGEVVGDPRAAQYEAFERRFSAVSRVLDDLVPVPGTSARVGLDPLIGLIPVVGDAISGVIGFWLIAEATRFGVPRVVVARMALNTIVDLLLGAVPILGDLFDVASRSNARNLALFRRHALEPGASTRQEQLVLVGLGAIVIGVLWLAAAAIGWLLSLEIAAP